ncbi:MAG TPA: HD domain-containing protein [Methanospirillum sp.]|uniref:HD domain-containing protein n=1 Tax=Methanospirillum sp. TaxID=45200 RepID=UPI002B8A81CF|nr:HD domain-containing protein [Methanospirillum sp.]HOJ96073.1 HD domain-containing protein [Methanospirillum sp.]HOL40423.1 HD domain-containing protein [Methanospirillum sp.]HPP77201.1 HD domain-containing protein [Methanospirillum sp.]
MNAEVWPVILDYTNRLDPDPAHAKQVCHLSGMMFDGLSPLHRLPSDVRDLLQAAALLHDIGWSVPDTPHHKASRDIILKDTRMNLSGKERMMIALIARYHRKSLPRAGHAVFRELNGEAQHVVCWSSGILRIADALDRAHQNQVRTVTCTITATEIILSCSCISPLRIDSFVFTEKSRLLQKITSRRICLSCT